jgi:hypothetical protein
MNSELFFQVPGLAWGDGASFCRDVTDGGSFTCQKNYYFFRFFETEGIAIMTTLVSKYRVEIKEEPEFAGETFEERYARITASREGLTTM